MSNTPTDHKQGDAATSHHIGVGGSASMGGATTKDGKTEYGPAFAWGNDPIGRVKAKLEAAAGGEMPAETDNKVVDEVAAEDDHEIYTGVPPAPKPAEQLEITPEWIVRYFQTGGFVVGGLRVAPGLPSGKGWQLAAQDGRYLFLVSGEAFAKGLDLFINILRRQAIQAQLSVFPANMEDLMDDPNIGPLVSMMMPTPQAPPAERVDDPLE